MTERELQALVLEACRWLRLTAYHTHDSRRSQPGFPDLVIVGSHVLWRELKSDTGRLTRDQRSWLDRLTHAGQDAGVWRPRDWRNGHIVTELRALTCPRAPSVPQCAPGTRSETVPPCPAL